MKKYLCSFILLILVALSVLTLSGCVVIHTMEYQAKKSSGIYPDANDFPLTEWKAEDRDFSIYMLDKGFTNDLIGRYAVDDKEYIIHITDRSSMWRCMIYETEETNAIGFLDLLYEYNKETEEMTVSVRVSESELFSTGEKIVFKQAGSICEDVRETFGCETDSFSLRINSFNDVPDYYRGLYVADGRGYDAIAYVEGNHIVIYHKEYERGRTYLKVIAEGNVEATTEGLQLANMKTYYVNIDFPETILMGKTEYYPVMH